ncbi:hypothetical protein AB3S75_039952 [Citrus x aurantiifolia]
MLPKLKAAVGNLRTRGQELASPRRTRMGKC